jgi:methylmalonyl-CoA/ethylmalonyl-CoA epimerase
MKIDHIGIATERASAAAIWQHLLGAEEVHSEDVPDQGVRVTMLPIGESRVELLEPLSADSPVGRFLEKRGPGIHHLAIRVENIREILERLRAKGVRLIDETPRLGAGGCLVAFIHPSAANGVLLELVEHQQ